MSPRKTFCESQIFRDQKEIRMYVWTINPQNHKRETHPYLLKGTAFLRAFSTSVSVARASWATVHRPWP